MTKYSVVIKNGDGSITRGWDFEEIVETDKELKGVGLIDRLYPGGDRTWGKEYIRAYEIREWKDHELVSVRRWENKNLGGWG